MSDACLEEPSEIWRGGRFSREDLSVFYIVSFG